MNREVVLAAYIYIYIHVQRERITEARRCMNREVVLAAYTCTERKAHRGQEMYEQGGGAGCIYIYTCTERKDHRGQEMCEQGGGAGCTYTVRKDQNHEWK